jgi:hypothetical protein
MKMAKWNLSKEIQIQWLNLGTLDEPKMVKLNANLDPSMANVTKLLLKEYKYIFTWTYKDLRNIPLHLTQHQIELNTNMPTSHQTWYWMNLNYVTVMK